MVCLGLAMAFGIHQTVRWTMMGSGFVRMENSKKKIPLNEIKAPQPNKAYYATLEQKVQYSRGTFPLIKREVMEQTTGVSAEEL